MPLCQGKDLITRVTDKLYTHTITKRSPKQRNRGKQCRGVAEPLINRARVPNSQHLFLVLEQRRRREVLLRITVIDHLRRFIVTPAQLFRPNRRDAHQHRGISDHQPFYRGVHRPAPTRFTVTVIRIVDPKVAEIGDPGDVEGSPEPTGDNQAGEWRRAGEDYVGPPVLDKSTTSQNRCLGPIPAHVGDIDYGVVLAFKPIPSRLSRRLTLERRGLTACTRCHCRSAAEGATEKGKPVPSLPIIGIDDLFSWDLERQASITAELGRQDAHVVPVPIEISGQLADADCADDVGWREPEGDNQNFHTAAELNEPALTPPDDRDTVLTTISPSTLRPAREIGKRCRNRRQYPSAHGVVSHAACNGYRPV